jgi:hypothetical protein
MAVKPPDDLPADPWSIGIFTGPDPLRLAPPAGTANPVLTRDDVTDVAAAFVADPFLLRHDDAWHLFFEVFRHDTQRGEIGWASSPDAVRWTYRQIVLREPFHLSYPHVLAHGDDIFMVPETLDAGAVRLYRADPFPTRWAPVGDLVAGRLADPTPFRFDGRWWMFACPTPATHDSLALFCAPRLTGPWRTHPLSPLIVGDRRAARPAGRVTIWQDTAYRLAQDCGPRYGSAVRAFEILALRAETYAERECAESPIVRAAGAGWNRKGMHHVDAWPLPEGGWIAAVDGIGMPMR